MTSFSLPVQTVCNNALPILPACNLKQDIQEGFLFVLECILGIVNLSYSSNTYQASSKTKDNHNCSRYVEKAKKNDAHEWNQKLINKYYKNCEKITKTRNNDYLASSTYSKDMGPYVDKVYISINKLLQKAKFHKNRNEDIKSLSTVMRVINIAIVTLPKEHNLAKEVVKVWSAQEKLPDKNTVKLQWTLLYQYFKTHKINNLGRDKLSLRIINKGILGCL